MRRRNLAVTIHIHTRESLRPFRASGLLSDFDVRISDFIWVAPLKTEMKAGCSLEPGAWSFFPLKSLCEKWGKGGTGHWPVPSGDAGRNGGARPL